LKNGIDLVRKRVHIQRVTPGMQLVFPPRQLSRA
jgi:hypothetical protein